MYNQKKVVLKKFLKRFVLALTISGETIYVWQENL
jgi:hypothetical protein